MGERRVVIIGLAIYVGLGIAAWFLLYQPRIKARQAAAAQVADLRKQLQETQDRVKQTPQLRQQKAQIESDISGIWARIVPRTEMLLMLRRLAQDAQQAKVRFLEVSPPGLDTLLQEENAANAVRSVPFTVTVQGRYLDVGHYVEGLDRFPYFVRVPDLEVNAREDIRPEVEAKLLVNLYTSSLAGGGRL
jgi:Tfp pilus assembly protein PilO